MLVSTDVRRPAAIQQLNVLGQKAALRVFDPAGEMDPVRRAAGALRRGEESRVRRRDRGHGRPPAHRRRADERAAGDQGGRVAVRPDLRGRRDDRPGRDQERGRVQPPRRRHRRDAEQARRRRPRRRGALGRGRRRRADRVCRQRRAARGHRAVPSRPPGVAAARHGRRAVAHREGRAGHRPGGRGAARAEDPARRLHARGFPGSAPDASGRWGRSRACSG